MVEKETMDQAVAYIKSHWKRGKNLTEIASLFKVDSGNLTRAFRMSEGTTVKQFLDTKRKEYVVEKLSDHVGFGYQIGVELGFQNDFSFYRWVHRAFGVSFNQLREKYRKPTTVNYNKK